MKDLIKDPFIIQTAKDYNMSYSEAERINKMYPNKFYQKLEEYIKDRANINN